jgi:hypothetical protein
MAQFQFRILTDDYGGDETEMAMQGLAAIEMAIAINMQHFRRYPQDMCALACGKIRYDSATKDILDIVSEIRTAPVLIRDGKGLCIDIVAFDVAIKRTEGAPSYPIIINRQNGYFHFVTGLINGDGRELQYDPSEELERMGYVVTTQPANCKCA